RKNQRAKEECKTGKLLRIETAYYLQIGMPRRERIAALRHGRSDKDRHGSEHSHKQCKTFPPLGQTIYPGCPDHVRHAPPLVCRKPAPGRPTPRIPRPRRRPRTRTNAQLIRSLTRKQRNRRRAT